MKKLLTTTMALATAVTFSLATAQKANAKDGSILEVSTNITVAPLFSFAATTYAGEFSKDIRQQAVNDAIVFIADGQSSDILNNILSEVRASKAELSALSDKEISKEIIRAAIQNP